MSAPDLPRTYAMLPLSLQYLRVSVYLYLNCICPAAKSVAETKCFVPSGTGHPTVSDQIFAHLTANGVARKRVLTAIGAARKRGAEAEAAANAHACRKLAAHAAVAANADAASS
jgi:hypothetical protein